MANLIRSIGYSLGKVHSGMINYLCEMYREGNREPLESFLGFLGIKVPSNPIPRREWNSVDLAILEGSENDQGVPAILVEVKVDDFESGSSQDGYQTVRYAARWPSCQAYLFITLGKGEYYHPPRSDRFTWVRIRQFKKAIEVIKTNDCTIADWLDEVRREILLQDNVLIADKSHEGEYRGGTWNIYLFGHLAEILKPLFADENIDVEMTCYTYGSGPDTIFNFGWRRKPLYMEINYSGRLNLKISLDAAIEAERIEQEIDKCQKLPFAISPKFHRGGKIGSSKTFASFDVGLINKDGYLECQPSIENTKQKIFSVVSTFYGNKATV
ncbi:MAG: hypothetical protein WD425_05190 [Nitrospirales bacterium]